MNFKILALVGCLTFSGCAYDLVKHQKISALEDLNNELNRQQQQAKERYINYKLKGDMTGVNQTSQIMGITKGTIPVIKDVTDNAKPVAQFIPEKGKEFLENTAPWLPSPYGNLLEGALGLAGLAGGAFGVKKTHQVATRRGRIKQAVFAVKSSPIGKQGQFNPCDPEIVAAMKLYLNDNDFKVWKESHGC